MLQDEFLPEVEERGFGMTYGLCRIVPHHIGVPMAGWYRDWLNENFPNRWMGRGSPMMPWPARSPDLTPCDLFLWGFIKSKVYATKSRDITERKERIIAAFGEITVEMREKTILEYRDRLEFGKSNKTYNKLLLEYNFDLLQQIIT